MFRHMTPFHATASGIPEERYEPLNILIVFSFLYDVGAPMIFIHSSIPRPIAKPPTMSYLNGIDNDEYYGWIEDTDNDNNYEEFTLEFVHTYRETRDNNPIDTDATETEINPAEVVTQCSYAQYATLVDKKRASAITRVILDSESPDTLDKPYRNYATKQTVEYHEQAALAIKAIDETELSDLRTEIEAKVLNDIVRRRLVMTVFDAITRPETNYSLEGCPAKSGEFVHNMTLQYRRSLQNNSTRELWNEIGGKCDKFVERWGRAVRSTGVGE